MGFMSDMFQKGTKRALQRGTEEAQRQQTALFNQLKNIRQPLIQQTAEALRTGGVGAQIPFIQRGVEATKRATSMAIQKAEAQPGAGTPFGQRLINMIRTQGGLQEALLPTQGAQMLISGAPRLLGNLLQASTGLSQSLAGGGAGLAGQAKAGVQQGLQSITPSKSDERVKRDIVKVGTAPSGIGIYEYRFRGNPQRFRGPVAQDVQKVKPEAVEELMDGLLYVDLTQIDVPIVPLPPERGQDA